MSWVARKARNGRNQMALQTTRDALRSILRTDPTMSPEDRQRVLAALNAPAAAKATGTARAALPRIVRFAVAAEQLGCGVRLLHRLAQRGAIRKCRLPGRVRCHGILEEDLARLMAEGVRVAGEAVERLDGEAVGADDGVLDGVGPEVDGRGAAV